MKFKSMDDLRNLSDNEVEDFLKKYWKTNTLTFYGIFEANTENPKNFSGTISKVKVPGSSVLLKYPLSDIGLVTFKIPANKRLTGKYYKFSCRLLPNYTNRCQLQILLNTLEEIDSRTYDFTITQHSQYAPEQRPQRTLSPAAYRYQILEDEETGWGKDIHQLMGVYKKQQDGTYCLDDIRKPDLTKLSTYPKTTFRVGPLPLEKPIDGLEEGQYCLFNWKFSFAVKVNPCDIAVDETKPIIFITPENFISSVTTAIERQSSPTLPTKKQSDVCILIYDLLFEANRFTGNDVNVQFNLTDKYLSFQHTGRPLSAETILNLCGLGWEKSESQEDEVAYHCRGLREFLSSNDNVIIISNGFQLKFTNAGGKLNVSWLQKDDLSRGQKISIARNKRFTETIILPFSEKATFNNYKVGFHCVFDDEQNIAFYANIGKVSVKIKGEKDTLLDRGNWVVSKEYQTFIPKETREKLYGKNNNRSASASTEQHEKKHTSIMFACRYKGKVLIGEDDAPIYSLLPTTSSFGFPFLMNTDLHINKTNFAISRKDIWNKVYAEIAGRLFAKWIADLTVKAEFSSKSIYNIVPKFDKCIEDHPEDGTLIKLFYKGFKSVIMNEKKGPEESNHSTNSDTKQKTYKEQRSEPKPKAEPRIDPEPKPNPEPKPSSHQGKLYAIDTNIFVNCPDIIKRIGKQNTVLLSAKVVDELDNLKYKMEDKDLRDVQKALKNINQAIDSGNVRMEMSDVSLLPRDFDRHNPDNNILSVILRHKSESPTLITSDNGLQIKAKVLGINVIGLKDFLAEHKLRSPRKKKTE